MIRVILTITLSVCVLAAIATAWLGTASGLFSLVDSSWPLLILTPYLVLALLAWGSRRRPIPLCILLTLSILVSGYGLLLFYNDWYWPQPTQPNPRAIAWCKT
jgi:hypothetical protein